MSNKISMISLLLLIILLACSSDSDDSTPEIQEPDTVYILSVKATPTDQESITIKNNSGADQDLSNWKLGDKNDPDAYNIPNATLLANGQTKTFSHTTLGFGINDNGETIYLKNSSGSIIDTWSN